MDVFQSRTGFRGEIDKFNGTNMCRNNIVTTKNYNEVKVGRNMLINCHIRRAPQGLIGVETWCFSNVHLSKH